jgi:predicted Zn-dependent peptidase
VIAAGVDTDKTLKSLEMIVRELRRFGERSPTPGEVRRARDYVIGQLELGLENTESHMMWVGEQWLGYGKTASLDEVKRRFQDVTAAQIRSMARDYFRPERVSLAVVNAMKKGSAPRWERVLSL